MKPLISFRHIIKSEFGIILMGAAIILTLLVSSYFLTQKTEADNLQSFQDVIHRNLNYQYLLLNMSNSIRDQMLTIHDINLSSDPFSIDEYTQEFQQLAIKFIVARDLLLKLNLPPQQIKKLGKLRVQLSSFKIKLDKIIAAKTANNSVVYQNSLIAARNTNNELLIQIKILIEFQLDTANYNLDLVVEKNESSINLIKIINILALIISLFITGYIIKVLRSRRQQLDHAALKLEQHNKTLEITVSSRTSDLMLLQKEHAKVNAEIEVSRQLQAFIVPPHNELKQFKNLDITTYVEAAEEMGGDYIDVLPYENGELICIGDVTDHGLMSGIIMLMTQSIIRHQSNRHDIPLKQALNDINLSVFQNIQRLKSERHLSLSLLYLNEHKLSITGQHEPIIIVRNNGSIECVSTEDLGFYIGLVADIEPFSNTIEMTLEQGDLVLLHTDGITEAANANEELYGFERLSQQAISHHQSSSYDVVHNIIADVNRFVGAKALYDDIALIAFKRR